jgi:hypothetical protein
MVAAQEGGTPAALAEASWTLSALITMASVGVSVGHAHCRHWPERGAALASSNQ